VAQSVAAGVGVGDVVGSSSIAAVSVNNGVGCTESAGDSDGDGVGLAGDAGGVGDSHVFGGWCPLLPCPPG
jgi:hypothetical protein